MADSAPSTARDANERHHRLSIVSNPGRESPQAYSPLGSARVGPPAVFGMPSVTTNLGPDGSPSGSSYGLPRRESQSVFMDSLSVSQSAVSPAPGGGDDLLSGSMSPGLRAAARAPPEHHLRRPSSDVAQLGPLDGAWSPPPGASRHAQAMALGALSPPAPLDRSVSPGANYSIGVSPSTSMVAPASPGLSLGAPMPTNPPLAHSLGGSADLSV